MKYAKLIGTYAGVFLAMFVVCSLIALILCGLSVIYAKLIFAHGIVAAVLAVVFIAAAIATPFCKKALDEENPKVTLCPHSKDWDECPVCRH